MVDFAAVQGDRVQMEQLARRVLRNPQSHPDDVRAARYLLCVLERERKRPDQNATEGLPPFPALAEEGA